MCVRSICRVLIVFIFALKLNAQADGDYKWNVKLGILNFVDPGNPAVLVGVEHFLNNKNSIQLEGGYILDFIVGKDEYGIEPNYKGYIFRGSYKYWLFTDRFYFGPEIFALKNNYVARLRFAESLTDDEAPIYYDIVGVKREVMGLNIKAGYVVNFGRFFLDFTAGGGAAHRNVRHSGRSNPYDFFVNDEEFSINNIINEETNKITWNIALNVKFGCRF